MSSFRRRLRKRSKCGKKQIFTFDELAEETQITQDELKKLLEGTGVSGMNAENIRLLENRKKQF